jgi:DNA-binding MarR family transcriptional regulator
MYPSSKVSICACASLRRASRAVNHLYDLVLAPTGLRISQFLILCAIAELEEVAHCELARRFSASEETFSRRLSSARKAGWVQMKVDAQRRRVYRLTEAGHALMRLGLPNWERAQARLCRQLGKEDWNALVAFAERVTLAAVEAENAPCINSRPASIRNEAVPLDIPSMQHESFPTSPPVANS